MKTFISTAYETSFFSGREIKSQAKWYLFGRSYFFFLFEPWYKYKDAFIKKLVQASTDYLSSFPVHHHVLLVVSYPTVKFLHVKPRQKRGLDSRIITI